MTTINDKDNGEPRMKNLINMQCPLCKQEQYEEKYFGVQN